MGEAGRGTFASPEMRRTLLRWIELAGAGMSFSDDHPETETSPRPWYAALRANSARALRAVADTVIPPVCLACSAPVLGADALCPRCWRQMSFIRAPLCDRLGLPMPFGGQAGGGHLYRKSHAVKLTTKSDCRLDAALYKREVRVDRARAMLEKLQCRVSACRTQ